MLSFTGNPLDRASAERADPAWVATQKARADCRILPVWRLKPLVAQDRAGFLAAGGWEDHAGTGATLVFLGLRDGAPLFARDVSAIAEEALAGLFPGGAFTEMRAAAFVLPDADTAIAGQARALIDWHARHRFCPNCGAATDFSGGGYRRICPACGAEHFPRTDPVVIMLPVFKSADGHEECLVGRNARFPGGLHSAFAGFAEPGETIEEAVARELREEVNLAVGRVTYYASQPWPFPSSLMIGCFAQALSKDFRIDGTEIMEARWMGRSEVRARLAGEIADGIALPVPIAIAHHLIRHWAQGGA